VIRHANDFNGYVLVFTTLTPNSYTSMLCLHNVANFQTSAKNALQDETTLLTACYISLAAIGGVLLRIIIAQLFGEACANPGTIGWLSAGAPLCVTKDGSTTQQGGIIFADLPSNLLGSFLMGLFQDGTVLGLAVPMAIAWLPMNHSFQKATVLHVAFKTGFCGSLTTYSSWNSEMVVLIFGTPLKTRIWSALFGYIIGMETSLGSYVCGCAFARFLHRYACPVLAAEADASLVKRDEGVHINRNLPDFERRYLAHLELQNENGSAELYPTSRIDCLERWRISTVEIRRVGNAFLPVLLDIENAVFVERRLIPPASELIAREQGWDIDSLIDYITDKESDLRSLPSVASSASKHGVTIYMESPYMQLSLVATFLAVVFTVLLFGLIFVNAPNAFAITYRTMIYSMLLAPTGALLRWNLSGLNGGKCTLLPESWRWLPAGTFTANIFGSLVSIISVALEYRLQNNSSASFDATNFWSIGTIRAVKVGFAGCLTTVSTFVAEVSGFMQSRNNHAYPYIMTSLCTACLLSSIFYGMIVYII
jgi:fluoride ion exporter CrcB/FEX